MERQHGWQRWLLLLVLGYEGLGGLLGGALLVVAPDGHLMEMPVQMMRGTFRDFLVPGVILTCLGALNVVAFFAVLRRRPADWIAAGLALGGFAVWFFVEIVILSELHWLHAMWGLPVLAGIVAAVPLIPLRRETQRDLWLACGILSSLLYGAMSLFVPARWPGYDSASQVVSELSAVGAPTRPLWVVLGLLYTLLVIGFGWGVRMAAGRERPRLRFSGALIVIYGALGIGWTFAPMHLRGTLAAGGGTASDTVHLVLAAITEVLFLLALAFAAAALGRVFRVYSVMTCVALFAFGALTFQQSAGIAKGLPTPLIGVWERINIGLFLAWIIVLAVTLLVREHSRSTPASFPGIPQPA
jgi:hypothetical protein